MYVQLRRGRRLEKIYAVLGGFSWRLREDACKSRSARDGGVRRMKVETGKGRRTAGTQRAALRVVGGQTGGGGGMFGVVYGDARGVNTLAAEALRCRCELARWYYSR